MYIYRSRHGLNPELGFCGALFPEVSRGRKTPLTELPGQLLGNDQLRRFPEELAALSILGSVP